MGKRLDAIAGGALIEVEARPLPALQVDDVLAISFTQHDALRRLAPERPAAGREAFAPRSARLDPLERVARSDPKLVRGNEPRIRRTYLTRRLEEDVSDELLQQVIESRDATVQTKLVRDARLSRKQAGQLAKRGANPTIRQHAQAWFQDKKAWK